MTSVAALMTAVPELEFRKPLPGQTLNAMAWFPYGVDGLASAQAALNAIAALVGPDAEVSLTGGVYGRWAVSVTAGRLSTPEFGITDLS